jgi:hypothetical protein
MTALLDRDALEALLAFYRDSGVDAAIGEEATDWLAKGEAEIQAVEETRPIRETSGARPRVTHPAAAAARERRRRAAGTRIRCGFRPRGGPGPPATSTSCGRSSKASTAAR